MSTFLFAWNPVKWKWTDMEENIEQLEKTGVFSDMWSCASHTKVKPGDRAFLVKLGKKPTGIIASGYVATPAFLSQHWSGPDKMVPRVMIDFDTILNPSKEPILAVETLKQGNLSKQHWTPESSGISIKSELTKELEAVWFDFTKDKLYPPFLPTKKETKRTYSEGTPNQVTLTRYERNPHAREECIEHYGSSCNVCRFNFEETYGQTGKDFIHVHHLTQIASIGKKYNVDPITDLRPVCTNCHSIIHKRKPAYTIEEMIEMLNLTRKTNTSR